MNRLRETILERFRYEDGKVFVKKAGQWKGQVGDFAKLNFKEGIEC